MVKKKIMIVDDSFFITKLLSKILEDENFELIIAHSGEECLNILEVNRPDIILLDMLMPGMSGREVCERIRMNPKTKNVKIIFLTGANFSAEGKKKLGELGISDFFEKKFDDDDIKRLLTCINKALY